jgi:hypothetical protein
VHHTHRRAIKPSTSVVHRRNTGGRPCLAVMLRRGEELPTTGNRGCAE